MSKMRMPTIPTIGCVILLNVFSHQSSGQLPCIPAFAGTINNLENFAFHTLVNIYSGVAPTSYIAYPDTVFTTTLTLGETYPITISTEYTAGSLSEFGAWLDYNNDSIFDASEVIHYDTTSMYTTSGFVTIPNNPGFVGQRKLRIMYSGNPQPCGNNGYGEAEDYVVSIVAAQPDSQTYCIPFLPNGSSNFDIDDFMLHTLSNFNSGSNAASYIIYPSTQFTTTLIMGTSYPTSVSKGISAGNTGGYAMWIDLDNDGEFASAEQVFSAGPGLTSASGSIVIPYNASFNGERRLRVRSKWASVPPDPCGLFNAGEAEDYIITIADTVTSLNEQPSANIKTVLFPNPSRGNVTIQSSVSMDNIVISDALGRQVVQLNPGTSHATIHLEQQGIFFVTITAGETSSTLRLLVIP
jgi:hypothetical protein